MFINYYILNTIKFIKYMISKYKKYNSVSHREWPNNVYSYNRNNEKLLSYKKDKTDKIIKSYFNLTKKENSFKSKRMRDLIKRSSSMRLFNSKGIIKQNSDKINVSIHTFNKRKSKTLKNLFNFNKFILKFKRYNLFTYNRTLTKMNKYNNINLLKTIKITDTNLLSLTSKLNLTNHLKSTALPKGYSNKNINNSINYKNKKLSFVPLTKINNYRYHNIYKKNMFYSINNFKINKTNKYDSKFVSLNKKVLFRKKKIILQKKRNLLYNKLIKTLPLSFERKRTILYKIVTQRAFYNSILKSKGLYLRTYLKKNLCVINIKSLNNSIENKNIIIKLPNKYSKINNIHNLLKIDYKKSRLFNNKINIKNRNKIKMLNEITNLKFQRYMYINNMLEKIVNQILIKSTIYQGLFDNLVNKNNNLTIHSTENKNITILKKRLYNEFKKYNIRKLFMRFFGKQYLILNNIYKLYLDNEKYTGLTNNLKYILNKIYNKKVNLNITELKYLHLNADMLSNMVVIKLTNMKNRLRKIIRKTLKLVKLTKLKSNTLRTNNIRTYISFNNLINEMYNSKFSNILNNYSNKNIDINTTLGMMLEPKNKTKEIIKKLKYKWITGARLEGKGRLTNRYAAARALYKYKAKGNLRSKLKYTNQNYIVSSRQEYINNKVSKKNPYVPLFRGILMPNLQYIRKSGFRRIGAFGIKLWINNN